MGGYFVLAAENSHPAQLYRDSHAGIKLCFGWLGRTYIVLHGNLNTEVVTAECIQESWVPLAYSADLTVVCA